MLNPQPLPYPVASEHLPWDARLARRLVAPLVATWVSPNHLTSLRLVVGLAAAGALIPGSYAWSNIASLLLVVSNFLDHTDGELARMSGKTSRIGHLYDLASDAVVTILLFIAIGVGIAAKSTMHMPVSSVGLGFVAGAAIALIFYLRMRIEEMHGKTATRQASLGGFETEDVLYLFPLATLSNSLAPILLVAAISAPLYAVWVIVDYRRMRRRDRRLTAGIAG
ncbi:MAG TPA: CDP-alcohol phosphatidyltransferase family protein [Steroidobacteraceae bacterium]